MYKLKNIHFAIFILVCIQVLACSVNHRISYDLPGEMLAPVKLEYIKICDKGKILFDKNCAGCHLLKLNGRSVIPDFALHQLETYQIRISNSRHMKNVTEEAITAEELGYVITFLTYKKKSGAEWKSVSK